MPAAMPMSQVRRSSATTTWRVVSVTSLAVDVLLTVVLRRLIVRPSRLPSKPLCRRFNSM